MELPSVPPSGAIRFRVTLRTRWSDEDTQQVLNNAVYPTLFEEARLQYFGRLGLMDANRFPFVLAQSNVRFLAPGRGGIEVEVEAVTTHLGRSSFAQAYRVREREGGTVLCEAEALLVAWDGARRTKTELAPELRAALAEYDGLAAR